VKKFDYTYIHLYTSYHYHNVTYRHTGNYLGRTSSAVTQHTQRSWDAA